MTRAHAVYVKDMDTNKVSVRVMRMKFDPFVDYPDKMVRIPKFGYRVCLKNGKVGNGSWYWRYVDENLHVAHKLSN